MRWRGKGVISLLIALRLSLFMMEVAFDAALMVQLVPTPLWDLIIAISLRVPKLRGGWKQKMNIEKH